MEAGDEPAAGTVSEAIARDEHNWAKGQLDMDMGPSAGRVCFLTRVSGKFYSTNDFVQIIKRNGNWILTGGGTAPGGTVGATAVCVAGTDRGESLLVTATPGSPKSVGLGSGGACFLTHVGGHFGGGGESVLINGNWTLNVKANTPEGVQARARCISNKSPITLSNGSTVASWTQGHSATTLILDPHGDPWNPAAACYLLSLTGKFMGYDERVSAYYNTDTTMHYVGGHVGALGGSMGASAACLWQ
jgi:hypothetical protein